MQGFVASRNGFIGRSVLTRLSSAPQVCASKRRILTNHPHQPKTGCRGAQLKDWNQQKKLIVGATRLKLDGSIVRIKRILEQYVKGKTYARPASGMKTSATTALKKGSMPCDAPCSVLRGTGQDARLSTLPAAFFLRLNADPYDRQRVNTTWRRLIDTRTLY